MNKYSRLPDKWYVKIRKDEHGTKGYKVISIINEISGEYWLAGVNGIFTVIDGKSRYWYINSVLVFVGVELTVDEVLSLVEDEVKQNPKPEVQVGDIGVRTIENSSHEVGEMLKAQYRDNDYWNREWTTGQFPYKDGYSVEKSKWRYATDKEIEFYNNGIRNINDIPEYKDDRLNYSTREVVVVLEGSNICNAEDVGKIDTIISIDKNKHSKIPFEFDNYWAKRVRKATKEEIEAFEVGIIHIDEIAKRKAQRNDMAAETTPVGVFGIDPIDSFEEYSKTPLEAYGTFRDAYIDELNRVAIQTGLHAQERNSDYAEWADQVVLPWTLSNPPVNMTRPTKPSKIKEIPLIKVKRR